MPMWQASGRPEVVQARTAQGAQASPGDHHIRAGTAKWTRTCGLCQCIRYDGERGPSGRQLQVALPNGSLHEPRPVSALGNDWKWELGTRIPAFRGSAMWFACSAPNPWLKTPEPGSISSETPKLGCGCVNHIYIEVLKPNHQVVIVPIQPGYNPLPRGKGTARCSCPTYHTKSDLPPCPVAFIHLLNIRMVAVLKIASISKLSAAGAAWFTKQIISWVPSPGLKGSRHIQLALFPPPHSPLSQRAPLFCPCILSRVIYVKILSSVFNYVESIQSQNDVDYKKRRRGIAGRMVLGRNHGRNLRGLRSAREQPFRQFSVRPPMFSLPPSLCRKVSIPTGMD